MDSLSLKSACSRSLSCPPVWFDSHPPTQFFPNSFSPSGIERHIGLSNRLASGGGKEPNESRNQSPARPRMRGRGSGEPTLPRYKEKKPEGSDGSVFLGAFRVNTKRGATEGSERVNKRYSMIACSPQIGAAGTNVKASSLPPPF